MAAQSALVWSWRVKKFLIVRAFSKKALRAKVAAITQEQNA